MPSADGLIDTTSLAQAILPNNFNMATISTSAPFPKITIDLTQSPNPTQYMRHPDRSGMPFPNAPLVAGGNAAVEALLPQIFNQTLHNLSTFSGLRMTRDVDHGDNRQLEFVGKGFTDVANAMANDLSFKAALAASITSVIGGSCMSNCVNSVPVKMADVKEDEEDDNNNNNQLKTWAHDSGDDQ